MAKQKTSELHMRGVSFFQVYLFHGTMLSGGKTVPNVLRKLLGLILLFATVGVATWQALLAV
jgi:hypothetical protein